MPKYRKRKKSSSTPETRDGDKPATKHIRLDKHEGQGNGKNLARLCSPRKSRRSDKKQTHKSFNLGYDSPEACSSILSSSNVPCSAVCSQEAISTELSSTILELETDDVILNCDQGVLNNDTPVETTTFEVVEENTSTISNNVNHVESEVYFTTTNGFKMPNLTFDGLDSSNNDHWSPTQLATVEIIEDSQLKSQESIGQTSISDANVGTSVRIEAYNVPIEPLTVEVVTDEYLQPQMEIGSSPILPPDGHNLSSEETVQPIPVDVHAMVENNRVGGDIDGIQTEGMNEQRYEEILENEVQNIFIAILDIAVQNGIPLQEFFELDHVLEEEESIGLTQTELDSITVTQFDGQNFNPNCLIKCSICLNAFVHGDEVRSLIGCAHTFHQPCIDEWLKFNANCPLCRRTVTPQ